jgi:pimeloyl-ACP methyl ester carboxylesterase
MTPTRRKMLAAGAAATAMAAAQRVFAQQTGQGGAAMSFYEKGPVRIHYEEAGSGFPLLLIAGGGLNSTIAGLKRGDPFNPIEEFKGEYRCIASDLRNANGGQSSGPLEIDRPWDAYTDDHLGVMDHLRIDKFMVMGFCIGGPFIWNLLERAPNRVVAAVLAQPSGSRPEMRDLFYDNNMKGWGPELVKRRPEITMEIVDKFLTRMYRTNADFVFTVTRDFVRGCRTPLLILPDDIPAHPYAVAMEAAMLAPKAEVSIFPWKEPKERIPLAVRQIRSFLRAHRPDSI